MAFSQRPAPNRARAPTVVTRTTFRRSAGTAAESDFY
jgi:hypothetical protein